MSTVDVFGGPKLLVKPVTWQKTCNYMELFGSSTGDRHAQRNIVANVQRITLNASSCITILDGRTEQLNIIAGFLPHHWFYE